MRLKGLVLFAPVLPLLACASAGVAPPKLDLAPAREAVEAARRAGAPERAPETFSKAEGHLNEAEALAAAGGRDAADKARQAEWLGRLAAAEAQCASAITQLLAQQQQAQVSTKPTGSSALEVEKLTARLRKAEEEQHKLEEKAALLQRNLDVTETEVIRTKAKLKGLETKAEASSAIAEARILIRRVSSDRSSASSVRGAQQDLARAEQELEKENFGAAAFFAMRAQEVLDETKYGPIVRSNDTERPAPKKQYVVKGSAANIRKGPSASEPVVGKAPKGATLDASVVHGGWVKVNYGEVTGWVSLSVLQ